MNNFVEKNSSVLMVGHKLAPVAQSVSALYLYGSKAPKRCGGCEFEPHLGQKYFYPYLNQYKQQAPLNKRTQFQRLT